MNVKSRTSWNFAQNLRNLSFRFQGIDEFVENTIKQRLSGVNTLPVVASFDSALFCDSQVTGRTFSEWAVFTHTTASRSHILMVKDDKVIPTPDEGPGPFYKRKKLVSETEILDIATFGQDDENLLCLHSKNGNGGSIDFLSMIPEHIENYEIAGWGAQMGRCLAADYRSGRIIVGQKSGIEILDVFSLRSFSAYHDLNPWCLEVERLNETVYCGCNDGYLHSIDFRAHSESSRAPVFLDLPVSDLKILNDGVTLVLGSFGSQIKLFDTRMNRSILEFPTVFKVDPSPIKVPLTIDQANRSLCSACQNGNVRIWNLRDGSMFKEIEVEGTFSEGRTPGVALSSFKGQFPSTSSLLVCSSDGLIRSFAV